jgi:hypothetical protein
MHAHNPACACARACMRMRVCVYVCVLKRYEGRRENSQGGEEQLHDPGIEQRSEEGGEVELELGGLLGHGHDPEQGRGGHHG